MRSLCNVLGKVGYGYSLVLSGAIAGALGLAAFLGVTALLRWIWKKYNARRNKPDAYEFILQISRKKKKNKFFDRVKRKKRDDEIWNLQAPHAEVTEQSWGGTTTAHSKCLACQRSGHLNTAFRTLTQCDPFYTVDELDVGFRAELIANVCDDGSPRLFRQSGLRPPSKSLKVMLSETGSPRRRALGLTKLLFSGSAQLVSLPSREMESHQALSPE